ncbi:hypothetical protein RRG08_003421 [Elysia crispata]|uniref:Uncharacterized protein n=1 Tax=Elysia crispata TaxID=231223 RepID=A0AAE1AB20_9GAST|nr:hypothetical protein RRG08_003421 [Elysia crispata]
MAESKIRLNDRELVFGKLARIQLLLYDSWPSARGGHTCICDGNSTLASANSWIRGAYSVRTSNMQADGTQSMVLIWPVYNVNLNQPVVLM